MDVRGTVSVLLVLLTAPYTRPCRIPTENTVENQFKKSIDPTKAFDYLINRSHMLDYGRSIPQAFDYGQTEKQRMLTVL